jgi:hypothetical protein
MSMNKRENSILGNYHGADNSLGEGWVLKRCRNVALSKALESDVGYNIVL